MIAFGLGGCMQHECGGWVGEARYAGGNGIGNTDCEAAMAARCVAEARRIVARQRARVLRFKTLGRATLDHELTLRALVSTLAILEGGAREFADAATRFERRRCKLS